VVAPGGACNNARGFLWIFIVYLIKILYMSVGLAFYIFPIYTDGMATNPRLKKNRGRPAKNPDRLKSESVLLRMEPAEKKTFTEAADLAGVPLASWIRERLRRVARHELKEAGRQVAFLDGNGFHGATT
jgi:hypothetical protein